MNKLVLIKSLLFNISIHVMSCFWISTVVCQQVINCIHMYWWGESKNKTKTAWISWKKICNRKQEGGVGFKDLHLFDQALLEKKGWKLFNQLNSLSYFVPINLSPVPIFLSCCLRFLDIFYMVKPNLEQKLAWPR